ncbi:MAG: hypothetical protein QME90_00210 [Thermodesulfobacteriota bacterium]|nr:hypothetical protein [Thermodesulfobacteriota bacterium]
MGEGIRYRGRIFGAREIDQIKEVIASHFYFFFSSSTPYLNIFIFMRQTLMIPLLIVTGHRSK